MFRFVVLATLIVLAASQGYHQDPKTAAIISEQRYLSGDGKFGAAYTQEDGINFKEETDADGTRHGSYSYVDPTGERRTISYTAGKNGFQASGDHIPVAPPAPPQPVPQAGYAPQPQHQAQAAPASNYRSEDYGDDGSYDPRYNDPSFGQNQQAHRQPAPKQPAYNAQAAAYNPPPPQYNAPAPAYKQPAPVYNAPAQQQQQQYNAPQQQYNQPQPQQQYNQPQPQQYYQPATTPNPHRFAPPGKLSLNRTPDGFTYSFNKAR